MIHLLNKLIFILIKACFYLVNCNDFRNVSIKFIRILEIAWYNLTALRLIVIILQSVWPRYVVFLSQSTLYYASKVLYITRSKAYLDLDIYLHCG